MDGFEAGLRAKSICDNPFWPEYPKPSQKGPEDERMARAFVDGYVEQFAPSRGNPGGGFLRPYFYPRIATQPSLKLDT